MTEAELKSAVHKLRKLKSQVDSLNREIKSLQYEITEYMDSQQPPVSELKGSDFKVTYKKVTTERVDVKRLRAELPQLAEQFVRASTTRRFLLS